MATTRTGGFTEGRAREINEFVDAMLAAGFLRKEGQSPGAARKSNSLWLFLTPGGGIPARSGTALGTANCTPQYVDENKQLQELLGKDGTSQTFEVLNLAGGAVAGGVYIQCGYAYGHYIVHMEDCS